jgi:hypothetical protein
MTPRDPRKNDGTLYFYVTVDEGRAVERKFKDFVEVRAAFARAFPGCYVPALLRLEVTMVLLSLNYSRTCLRLYS